MAYGVTRRAEVWLRNGFDSCHRGLSLTAGVGMVKEWLMA
jgi:hypothetical protein